MSPDPVAEAADPAPRPDGDSTPSPRPHGPGLGPSALRVALALLAFFAVAALIRGAVPPHMTVVTPKQRHWKAHGDDYSVLFLGTSRTYRHVIPAEFDEELRRLGVEERAFNFGAAHMTLAEATLLLDDVLSVRGSRLKTVVIDVDLFDDVEKRNQFTARHVYARAPIETWHVLGANLDGARDLGKAAVDLKALALNVMAVGRLADAFARRWDHRMVDEEDDDDRVAAHGYRSMENMRKTIATKLRASFLAKPGKYAAKLAARHKHPKKTRGTSAYNRWMLERLVQRVRRAGLRPVLYQAPTIEPPFRVRGKLAKLPRLAANDPIAYPEFYEVESRFDFGHMSERGARLLSRHLAREFARVVHRVPSGPSP